MKFYKKRANQDHQKNSLITLLIFLSTFLSLSLTFVSGYFSSESLFEDNSIYISEIVDKCVPTKDLMAVSLESVGSDSLPNSETEFLNLYGVFRQEKITFTSGYNLTKENSVTIEELENSVNYSVGYLGSTVSSNEYKGHYKDANYPVEFMFPCKRYDNVSMQTAIIGQHQADLLLEKRHREKSSGGYTSEDYFSLIASIINITIEGKSYPFVIQDIFYDSTYYVTGISNTVGDFFFTSYYFPNVLKKQNAYFMCKYSYENAFFMKYINSVYTEKDNFSIKCVKNKITKEFDEERALNFYYNEISKDVFVKTILTVVSSFLLFIALSLIFVFIKKYNILILISHSAFAFLPFIIFKIIYLISGNVRIFSEFGATLNSIFLLVFIVSNICIYLFKKNYVGKLKITESSEYEIDI